MDDVTAAGLRRDMVDTLRAENAIRSGPVEAALLAVPRHRFLPGVPAGIAYLTDDAVVTKRDVAGAALSSASAPRIVAIMLEQLAVRPGQRILEIGAGTGWNAALLARLTGPSGAVTTIDLDQEVTDRARRALADTGFERVRVLCRDGELGDPDRAPYDRIIVTVGAWDLPSAWRDQLTPGGRIVLPLRLPQDTTRSVAFDRVGTHLISRSLYQCGFIPIRGLGEHRDPGLPVDLTGTGDVTLTWPDSVSTATTDRTTSPGTHPATDPGPGTRRATRLAAALAQPPREVRTGVVVPTGDALQQLDLWLALTTPGFCRLVARAAAVARGLVTPALRRGDPAISDGVSFAYLSARPAPADETGHSRLDLGVVAHGPDAAALQQTFTERLRRWDREHADGPGPTIEVRPRDDVPATDQILIHKRATTLVVSWPTAADPGSGRSARRPPLS